MRILHIEDQLHDTEIVSEVLAAEGLHATIDRVDTMPAFLKALNRGKYDLFISDYSIPGIDPREILRLTRERSPDLPFIFLSGSGREDEVVDSLRLGATDYVVKQRIARLAPAIRRALRDVEERRLRQHESEQRMQAEKALHEGEARFKSFVEATAQVVWRTNRKGEADQPMPSWKAFTGQSERESAGFGWTNAIHPDDRQRAFEVWRAASAAGGIFEAEYRLERHDGEWRNVLGRGVPVFGEHGEIREYIGTCNDITEQRRTEAAIQKQAQLIHLAPAATIVSNSESVITFWSAGAQKLYGWTAEEALGRNAQLLLHTVFPKPASEVFAILRRGERWSGELQQQTKTGQSVYVQSYWLGKLGPDGKLVEFMESNMDITERRQIEGALRSSEERYRTLFNAIDEGFCIIEVLFNQSQQPIDYKYLEANPSFSTQVGAGGAIGKTARELIPHLEQHWIELFGRVVTTGESVRYQGRVESLDQWFEGFAFRIGPPESHHAGILFRDITARKRSEEALRRSEQRLRVMFESDMIGTFFWNTRGEITEANDKFLEMVGYSREDLQLGGLRWAEMTPAEYREADRRGLAELAARGVETPYEKEFIRKNGTRIPVIIGAATVDTARFEGVAFALDITKRKAAEEMLQRRNSHLQVLHHAAAELLLGRPPVELVRALHPEIASRFGAEVVMLYTNTPKASHMTLAACAGVSQEEEKKLETMRYGRAVCAKPEEAKAPIIATHVQTVDAPNRRFIRKLGFRSYLYYPLTARDQLLGTVAFASYVREEFDETDLEFFETIARTFSEAMERERLESELQHHAENLEHLVRERTAKLQEMVAELEHFSYTLTHDLRAPLRAMRGFATILLEECAAGVQEQHRQMLERIEDAAERMDTLITDSLQYSVLVRDQFTLEPVDSDALLRGILATYPQFEATRAHINVEGRLPMVLANKAGLTQCFSNLLGNAVKFVHPGQMPEVLIRSEPVPASEEADHEAETRPVAEAAHANLSAWHIPEHLATATAPAASEGSKYVRIWFEDKGIGIDKQYHDKIWVMFQTLSNAYPGTGIGLALVRKAVERMGGRVGVESEPGKGSRFWIELQLVSSTKTP